MIGRWLRNRTGGTARSGRLPALPGLSVPASAGLLTCRVVDPVDQPVARAGVTVNDAVGREVVTGQTDPYGTFAVAVPAGEYRLAVAAEGFAPYRGSAVTTAGEVTTTGDVTLDFARPAELPPPGEWEIDPAHSMLQFTARHIALARVHGRFDNFAGALRIGESMEDSAMHVVIEAASIDTNVKMRDDHLRSADFLDVERFPTLEFYSDRFTHRGGDNWTVTGALTIHGVSRTVALDTRYLGTGHGMEGELRAACKATTELHREDYTLNWQHMLAKGIAVVGPSIDIALDIQVVAKS